MSSYFEELDYRPTPIGALSLRRRRELSLEVDVFEIKLGDKYLMSSLFTASEIALARLGLAELSTVDLDVVVGGLGLGYTAQAVLEHKAVKSLLIVEALDENGTSPLLIVADHAGKRFPRPLGQLSLSNAECEHHAAWDIGVGVVCCLIGKALNAVVVRQNYSRLVIDCNRTPGSGTSILDLSELTRVPGNIGLSERCSTSSKYLSTQRLAQVCKAVMIGIAYCASI